MRFWDGRINRTTYWAAFAAAVGVITGVRLLGFDSRMFELLLGIICIPRMHDMGWSGRWILLPLAVLFGGSIWAGASASSPEQVLIGAYTVTAMVFALMIWLGCLKGQPDWNEYGNPPPDGISFRQ
ncbi:DUF805 domain-containing protein [Brevundimonas bullata]